MNWFPGRIQPRFTDLDPQGHVNNVVVVDYLQQARAQFLLSGPAAGLLDSGCLVVGHQVEYLAPIGWSAEPVATPRLATPFITASLAVIIAYTA